MSNNSHSGVLATAIKTTMVSAIGNDALSGIDVDEMYYVRARQNQRPPYVVYGFPSIVRSHTFDTDVYLYTIRFDAYTKIDDGLDAHDVLVGGLHDLFHRQPDIVSPTLQALGWNTSTMQCTVGPSALPEEDYAYRTFMDFETYVSKA